MDYKVVTTVRGIIKYIGNSPVVAFDFETAPDEAHREEPKAALDPATAHICGCSFSVAEGTGIYVPVAHRYGVNIDKEEFFAFLTDFLTNPLITKVAHNIAFESAIAYARGIVIQPPVYDTMCAAQMTLKSDFGYHTLADSGLKTLATELFGEELPAFEDVAGGKQFDELDGHDPETVRYGAADSDFTLQLFQTFNDWFFCCIPEHRQIVENIESPAAVYIGIMKCNGIPVDTHLMKKQKEEAEAKMDLIKEDIAAMIGDVDIGANCSTAAFKDYLFNVLRLPVLKRTDKGNPTVNDEAMVLLREWCDANRPELSGLFALVQELRNLGKIKSTYIDGYLRHVNPVTGRIHPDMFGLSTDTGRMNCRNPNLQNMPRKGNDPVGVRNFVSAPDGYRILSLDFSQIELRVGAFYCRDEVMLETYRTNGDIHETTMKVIFGDDLSPDKGTAGYKECRAIAKNVNFGTFYGLYPRGLQRILQFKAGISKDERECEEILDHLKKGYTGLSAWQAEMKAEAARRTYTQTWLGRRRYLPQIHSDDWSERTFAERCALNTPIQGTAADVLKLAMGRVLQGLPDRPWLKPILQIHDELVFLVPEEHVNEAVEFVRRCMEAKPFLNFDVPLVAEAEVGSSFGELQELEG